MDSRIMSIIETHSLNAVYALVSHESKKIYIAEGNILKSLIRLYDSFKEGLNRDIQDDLDKLDLQVLEVSNDPEYRKLRVGHWMIQFKEYHQYRNRVPMTLKARVMYRVLDDGYAFYVELYDKKRKRRVVGVFEKESEARCFKDLHYPDGLYIDQIDYAKNELTTKYRSKSRNQVKIYGVS